MESIRLAFQGIWGHKLRSFLTMLGIIIGIASIITIVSTIQGTNEQIKQNLIGSGSNVVRVQLYENDALYDMSWAAIPKGVHVISPEKREQLESLPGVAAVSLYRSRRAGFSSDAYFGAKAFSGTIYGIDQHYFDVEGYQVMQGRGFIDSDYETCRKVALVDDVAASSLFADVEPLGQVLELGGETFTVVGVVTRTHTFVPNIQSFQDYYLYAETSGGNVFLPDSTWPILYGFDEPQSVTVRAESTDDMTRAGKAVADALTASQIYGSSALMEGDEFGLTTGTYAYRSEDLLEQAQQLQEMSTSTNQQLIWIAGISLLVGGIGVMNIMLVSVTERTSEIGLKKALGAKRRRILTQFLTEASVLTFLGGVVGVLTGAGLAEILSRVNQIPMIISIPAVVIAVSFSTAIGVIFGFVPAIKAANLNPIDALRRE